ncbi:MAG: phosphate--acyl-ACP acyltransferase, partial [Clostridia bacterium]|nr:phosphate--acyl-ACP acyltransferase [Clostridia bacterium]
MRIILDANGEKGVTEAAVKAAILAKKDFGADIILVGDKEKIKKLSGDAFPIIDAPDLILNTDEPVSAVKNKKNSSVVVSAGMLKNG